MIPAGTVLDGDQAKDTVFEAAPTGLTAEVVEVSVGQDFTLEKRSSKSSSRVLFCLMQSRSQATRGGSVLL